MARLNEEGKNKAIKLFDIPVSAGLGVFPDGEKYEMIEVGAEVPANSRVRCPNQQEQYGAQES